MKNLITAIVAIVALVAMTAAIASASTTIKAGATGTGASKSSSTYSDAKSNGWATFKGTMNPDGIVALVKPGVVPAGEEDFYVSSINLDNSWDNIYLAAYVEDASVNTSLGFSIWGAKGQVDALAGQTWYVSVNGEDVGSFVWDTEHTTATDPIFHYDFADTTLLQGIENAALIKLSSEAPTPEVPEPATMVAMLTGVAGLGSFVIRRKK